MTREELYHVLCAFGAKATLRNTPMTVQLPDKQWTDVWARWKEDDGSVGLLREDGSIHIFTGEWLRSSGVKL